MKILTTAVLLFAASAVSAAPIVSVSELEDAGSGLDRYVFSVDGGTAGEYGAFQIAITPDAGQQFANPAGAEIFALPSNQTGLIGQGTVTAGFTFLGVVRSPSELSGTFTSFGADTATFSGAFGQVVGDAGLAGSAVFTFADGGGNVLDALTQTVAFGAGPSIPEPTTAILAMLGLVGVAARRRS